MPWYRKRIERVLAIEADIRRRDGSLGTAVWLEVGARIAAVTDAGRPVEGVVGRIYQTPRDLATGVFRFACDPAGGGEKEQAP